MRISELLGSAVVDQYGQSCGQVHDVRISQGPVSRTEGSAQQSGGFLVVGLVVGGGTLSHAWGFAEGRARGPWLLRMMTTRGARRARFVAAQQVQNWGPGSVTVRGRAADLPRLTDELRP